MKKHRTWLLAVCVIFALLLVAAVGWNQQKTVNPEVNAEQSEQPFLSETDYSSHGNWAYFALGENKPVDLFLICPTVDMNDEFNMSLDDEATKSNFLGALNMERGIYEDSSRMFAPYYRQAAMKVYSLDRTEWEPYMDIAYRDISMAFSWYLEHISAPWEKPARTIGRPLFSCSRYQENAILISR